MDKEERKGKKKLIYDGNKCRRCPYNFYNAGIIQNYIWCFENFFSKGAFLEIFEAFKDLILIIVSILLLPIAGFVNYFINKNQVKRDYKYLSEKDFNKQFNPKFVDETTGEEKQ